ncbi:photosystem II reaction center W protein, chloroplastic isoform X2 [Medicago truncatula]|uniref:photosystem II reaction center W protein, chloroplastic isoform X2 n=1 Tax=Medicago truncatula TaxID=3880 RepID=UPI000D2F437B|nr:photosystem II reaction center W protein, chloroplastic isoform X2 [Medicago truncatula]
MATIIAGTSTSSIIRTSFVHKQPLGVSSHTVVAKVGRVRCSIEGKPDVQGSSSNIGMGASLIAAISAATLSSPAAMALVDERMSTEGTGLPFGLSNNLLGWLLFGVFGLIWALYFIYASSLDEDEDSGLSL